MQIQSIINEFVVKNIGESIEFYKNNFDFEIEMTVRR